MGWTCQYDHKGFCKRLKIACEPGIKGCILQQSTDGIVFNTYTPSFLKEEEKEQTQKREAPVYFSKSD